MSRSSHPTHYLLYSITMKYRPHPELADKIAAAGYTIQGFCEESGFPQGTLTGILYPESRPGRIGGMQGRTAHRLARVWAQARGIDEQAAFAEIIVTDDSADRPHAA
jgi:hypothetical protein